MGSIHKSGGGCRTAHGQVPSGRAKGLGRLWGLLGGQLSRKGISIETKAQTGAVGVGQGMRPRGRNMLHAEAEEQWRGVGVGEKPPEEFAHLRRDSGGTTEGFKHLRYMIKF